MTEPNRSVHLPSRPQVSARGEEILTVAATLFSQRGFHAVSIDEIGSAVGITGPGLYRHFSSKQAMLGQMLIRISETLLREGLARTAGVSSPVDALDALVAWHIEFALGNPALIVIQDRDMASLSEADRSQVRHLQRAYIEAWVDVVQQIRPGVGSGKARASVQAVFGMINSTPRSARIPPGEMATLLQVMAIAAFEAGAGACSPATIRPRAR